MRNLSLCVALVAVVGLSLPQVVRGADNSAASVDIVVVEKVSDRRFRLINKSTETLVYMKWLNQDDSPVPHCRYADDKVSICARDLYLDSSRRPALQEARLAPGKNVTFNALKSKALAVGVLLKVDGDQRIVWCDLE